MKRTRFKSAVINAKWLKVCLKPFLCICVFLAICKVSSVLSKDKQQMAISDSFYKTVISSGLHTGEIVLPRGIIQKLTGFDVSDAKSIIGEYSAIFSKEMAAKIPPEATSTPESEQPQPSAEVLPAEEKPLEERHASGGMKISNRTKIEIDPEALAREPLSFEIEEGKDDQILILHTHTTEGFTDSDTNKYLTNDSDRSLDENKNITAVGNAMREVFEENNIGVVHDKTVHDYPSFNGAYTRAMATIRSDLEAYPSVKIVLDVHRDGIVKEDGTRVKVASDINGEKVAQCMFVVGSNAILTHDNWKENMKLACKIQQKANEMYPGLMRPIILREERFNQQASRGSLIIEIGSNGNTLEEAIRGGKKMAQVICELLKK